MSKSNAPLVPTELLQRMHELNARGLLLAAEHELRRAAALEPRKPKSRGNTRER
jgi:hypothetical protein